MTPTDPTPAREPVTLDEQIAAVQRVLDVMVHHSVFDDAISPYHREGLQAALATLQQHKRAMAVVEAARVLVIALTAMDDFSPAWLEPINTALAAFDAAEPSETP